jgi:hypothetical protein
MNGYPDKQPQHAPVEETLTLVTASYLRDAIGGEIELGMS